MAANTKAKASVTRMQVLLKPEDETHLESLREQYRERHGVPLRRPDAVRLALAWAARTWGAAGAARTGEDDS